MFDFSSTPVAAQAPSPMSAEQISPVLSNRCFLAISKAEPDGLATCRKEARSVDVNRNHTPMESLAAHQELGPRHAVEEFNAWIDLAHEGLDASYGEMGLLYWHRAEAQRQLNQSAGLC